MIKYIIYIILLNDYDVSFEANYAIFKENN